MGRVGRIQRFDAKVQVRHAGSAQRVVSDTIAAAVGVGRIMKKYGGRTIVIGPSGRVGGESYNYNEHKRNIITNLNELGKAVTDIGLLAALHQQRPPSWRTFRRASASSRKAVSVTSVFFNCCARNRARRE